MATSIPQFSFSDGMLSIESPLSHMRLRWKPSPSAEELLPTERTWRPFLPEFRLLQPQTIVSEPDHLLPLAESSAPPLDKNAEKKHLAFAAFRAELPPNLISYVERFPSHQWPLLVLLHESPKIFDLAAATPVLAWCLANNSHFRERHPKSSGLLAVMHSYQKQRDILQWLGFPGTDAMVRLMRKILPEAASPTILNGLRLALQDPNSIPIGFSHLKKINAGVLALIGTPAFYPFLSPILLEEISESQDESEIPQTAVRLMDVLNLYRAMKTPKPLSSLRSIAQAEELLLQAEQAYEAQLAQLAIQEEETRRKADRRRKARSQGAGQQEKSRRRQLAIDRSRETGEKSFPPPPIPGNDQIVPLTDPKSLVMESHLQVNCVRRYAYRVAMGHIYIYRVLHPERATLSITLRPDGSWRRSELKGHGNCQVRKETEKIVDNWLAVHRISV